MKKIFSVFLAASLLLTGCGSEIGSSETAESTSPSELTTNGTTAYDPPTLDETTLTNGIAESTESSINSSKLNTHYTTTDLFSESYINNLGYRSLDEPEFRDYLDNAVYYDLVNQIDSSDFFVENVESVYLSDEYIEAITSNSQSNVYFGKTEQELQELFGGRKYVFYLKEDGSTDVKEAQEFEDDTLDRIIRNVAVGGGVILVCVTVSAVSASLGAPAISLIFAASAQTATIYGASGAVISGVAAGVVKGYQTGNFKEAIKEAALKGSEGFKWGAISGAIIGGVSKGTSLYGAAKQTEFTMHQYAQIQKETGYPLDVIKEFHNMKEYEVFRDANLKPTMVGNKSALIKTDIDLTRIDSKGRTNFERMQQGLAPQDSNGISYELHHVGQKKDGTLAILTQSEHDNPAIHGFLERTEAHAAGTNWDAERQAFWKLFASMIG